MDSLDAARVLEGLAQGDELSAANAESFVRAAISGRLGQEQLGAFLMAIARNGIGREARSALTKAYYEGDGLGVAKAFNSDIDKHSTGGVGDKLTFLACPLAAAAGVRVRKLSGASLLHCRGTIDKLGALPGFRHVADLNELTEEIDRFGFGIGKTSGELCAGDTLTYAVRNMCGAASAPDLIAASIMSKKLATGASGLVLDVKLGRGGLFSSDEHARRTARAMLDIAADHRLPTRIFLTDMSAPLGRAIGGALEVAEALACLQGHGVTEDLRELATAFAAAMMELASGSPSAESLVAVSKAWESGAAFQRLEGWLRHRGVDPDRVGKLMSAPGGLRVCAKGHGWVEQIDPQVLGRLSAELSAYDSSGTGDILLLKRVGDSVSRGEPVAIVNASEEFQPKVERSVAVAFRFGEEAPRRCSLIRDVLSTE